MGATFFGIRCHPMSTQAQIPENAAKNPLGLCERSSHLTEIKSPSGEDAVLKPQEARKTGISR